MSKWKISDFDINLDEGEEDLTWSRAWDKPYPDYDLGIIFHNALTDHYYEWAKELIATPQYEDWVKRQGHDYIEDKERKLRLIEQLEALKDHP